MPLVSLRSEPLQLPLNRALKRTFDVVFSLMVLLFLMPILIPILSVLIKLGSRGPVFFKQLRTGEDGRSFWCYKFRTMRVNLEADALQAIENDPRLTRIGGFLRRSNMDELPQFWNVLAGDMALVGPRPERQFYIDQISKINPHYQKLHRIRPGITSWGQVKYGYAENVEEMVQRLRYDLLYLENMSLAMDIKILFYTVVIVLKGSGK
jgi:lipopolysaccharide/colanic/teichoic acid biosynthesis glycosyltransferase